MADPGVGGGGATADSYIGSHISLTSKSEIRYEGILYTVDTENSNIALQNVRSFGTEGRKQDGPEIPPSDKVYDYIIFRGSDIKDLQVKSSPAVQTPPPQPPKDPAIISMPGRAHYSQGSPLPPAYPTAGDGSSGPAPYAVPPSAFTVPQLYHPSAWGRPPQPGTNGMMYWPTTYSYNQPSLVHPLPTHSQQQALQAQQQTQPLPPPVPHIGAAQPQPPSAPPASTVPSVISSMVGNVPPPPSLSPAPSTPTVTTITTAMASLQPSISMGPGSAGPGVGAGTGMSIMPPGGVGSGGLGSNSTANSALRATHEAASSALSPVSKTPRRIVGPVQPSFQPAVSPSAMGPTGGASNPSLSPGPTSAAASSPIASSLESLQVAKPLQRQGGGGAGPSTMMGKGGGGMMQPSKTRAEAENKGQELGKIGGGGQQQQPSAPLAPASMSAQGPQGHGQVPQMPLLPLPMPQKQMQRQPYRGGGRGSSWHNASGYQSQGNGIVIIPNHYVGRRGGRVRGGGGRGMQPQQFTEDFDFDAMNEKFKKEEVWGELGNLRADDKDKGSADNNAELANGNGEASGSDGTGNGSGTGGASNQTANTTGNPTANGLTRASGEPPKKGYEKDEFFDSISCDALDREAGSHNRPRFSEQRKIDTETFGPIPPRSGRGSGRGGRGGRRSGFRSGYYGIGAHLHGMHSGGRLMFHHHGRGRGTIVSHPGNMH